MDTADVRRYAEDLLDRPPFSMAHGEKSAYFDRAAAAMTRYHAERCEPYGKMLRTWGIDPSVDRPASEQLPLPVGIFKQMTLSSVGEASVHKTVTSSGTTGQSVSRIVLDRQTASTQTKVLAKIASDIVGARRLPMLIVDSPDVLRDRSKFSARGAGIAGFSMLGRGMTYALRPDMSVDWDAVDSFCEKNSDGEVLIFGFTFIVWSTLYQELKRAGRRLSMHGTLLHGGGWKRMRDQAVSPEVFRDEMRSSLGVGRTVDYYGMAEQTGSIAFECEHGHLHCSNFSDIIIRRADMSAAEIGERGLVELISLLPVSYPGHVILTEDEGEISGEDDCPCGRMGRYLKIHGRAQGAELRGCSDTYDRR